MLAYDSERAYRLRQLNSSMSTIDQFAVAWLPSRKRLDVIHGSALTGVNGRALSACSHRQKGVFKILLVRRRVPRML